jgi:cholesterol transport system auxiliary component
MNHPEQGSLSGLSGSAGRILLSLLLSLLMLQGCALPRAVGLVQFDLGLPPRSIFPLATVTLQVSELTAAPGLAATGIAYRLAYLDPYRPEFYRDSRWVAPPAVLLTERLRQAVAAAAAAATPTAVPRILSVELEEFSQVFSSATEARVQVRVRATLRSALQPSLGAASERRRVFEVTLPSPSPDAAGAVRGLSQASDQLLEQVLAWVAAT